MCSSFPTAPLEMSKWEMVGGGEEQGCEAPRVSGKERRKLEGEEKVIGHHNERFEPPILSFMSPMLSSSSLLFFSSSGLFPLVVVVVIVVVVSRESLVRGTGNCLLS